MTDPNPFPSSTPKSKFSVPEEDLILLEVLVKSPVFGALKRVLEGYRREAQSVLETSADLHQIHQTQGRIIGIKAIENISLLVQQWQEQNKTNGKVQVEIEKRSRRLKTQDPRPPIR